MSQSLESSYGPTIFYSEVDNKQKYQKALEYKSCGVRVFYFDVQGDKITTTDHDHEHNQSWRDELSRPGDTRNLVRNGESKSLEAVPIGKQRSRPPNPCLEAGTIVGVLPHQRKGSTGMKWMVVILWDCGYEKVYQEDNLKKLRVFDLGPAGYKGEMVFCDKCLIPVMGFAWRLAKDSDSGDLYDLCCTHYNENRDPHSKDRFYCNIPSGDLTSEKKRSKNESRSKSKDKFDLIGLFKGATVKDNEDSCVEQKCKHKGEIVKIVHKDKRMEISQRDMRKADYYNCYAEIIPKSGSREALIYRSVGAEGRVDITAEDPGVWGQIYPYHHPVLCMELMYEMASYRDSLYKIRGGVHKASSDDNKVDDANNTDGISTTSISSTVNQRDSSRTYGHQISGDTCSPQDTSSTHDADFVQSAQDASSTHDADIVQSAQDTSSTDDADIVKSAQDTSSTDDADIVQSAQDTSSTDDADIVKSAQDSSSTDIVQSAQDASSTHDADITQSAQDASSVGSLHEVSGVDELPVQGLHHDVNLHEDDGASDMCDTNNVHQDYCFMRRRDDSKKCYSLTISGTELTEITDTALWDECQELTTVILLMNQLTKLPQGLEIFRDTIELVCIQDNQFSTIPEMLYLFKKLKHLNMRGNYLSCIPSQFRIFENLTRLYLGGNDLNSLPDIFGEFPELEKASFTNNKLTRLPSSFSELTKLINLDISHNSITNFPEPLLKIKSLRHLNIKWNKIQKLTPSKNANLQLFKYTLQFLHQISYLELKGNPIWMHSLTEDRNYSLVLQELRKEKVLEEISSEGITCSLRINVLGESGAGKTSVVQALSQDKYVIPTTNKEHRHTVGIDRYYMPFKMGDKIIQLNIWDHAGDNKYAMMNDLFISDGNLVWIVVDLHKYSLKKRDFNGFIGEWLLQVMTHNAKPIIWIIGTHSDLCGDDNGRSELDHIRNHTFSLCMKLEKSMKANFSDLESEGTIPDSKEADKVNDMRKCLGAPQFMKENIKIFRVSNTYGFTGFQELKDSLQALPGEHNGAFKDLRDYLPTEWEKEINAFHKIDRSSSFFPTITISDFRETISNEILNYCHKVGEVYIMSAPSESYDDKVNVVLDVFQLIVLLRAVYHHDFKRELREAIESSPHATIKESAIEQAFSNREKRGVVSKDVLKMLWKCNDCSASFFEKVIELFSKFDLVYSDQEDVYFFPYLIESAFSENKMVFKNTVTTIAIRLDFDYLPKFFLQRLALKISSQEGSITFYKDGFHINNQSMSFGINVINKDESIQIVAFGIRCTSFLWQKIVDMMLHIHDLLRFWIFHGTLKLLALCPKCLEKNKLKAKEINAIELRTIQTKISQKITMACKKCKESNINLQSITLPSKEHKRLDEYKKLVVHKTEHDEFKEWVKESWKESKELETSPTSSYSMGSSADMFQNSVDVAPNN